MARLSFAGGEVDVSTFGADPYVPRKRGEAPAPGHHPTTLLEHDRYLRVVSMSAAGAQHFIGRTDAPVDLGPADPTRYKPGARVFGFRGSPGCDCKGCTAP